MWGDDLGFSKRKRPSKNTAALAYLAMLAALQLEAEFLYMSSQPGNQSLPVK